MGIFDKPYWDLIQTLHWIRYRDPTRTGLNTLARLTREISPEKLRGAQRSVWPKAQESREELVARLRTEAKLHEALLAGSIVAAGLKSDTGDRCEIDPMMWHDLSFQYRSSWGPYAGPRFGRQKVAAWTHLLFRREQILLLWPLPAQIGGRGIPPLDAAGTFEAIDGEIGKQAEARQTIAAESECRDWLMSQMRSGPQVNPKAYYRKSARSKFKVGIRAFDRAWRNAIVNTGTNEWGRSGPQSLHRFKTPNSS